MANIENLIHSLIQRTKDKKFLWEYLVGFPKLKNLSTHIATVNSDYFLDPNHFDMDLSFYAEYKDGYFVLLNVEPEILLFAFPTLDAHVKAPLNAQYQFQTELVRLSNLASRQHPNVEDFIDEFLADKD